MNTDVRHSMENEGTGNTSETMEDSEEIDVRWMIDWSYRILKW